MNRSLFTPRFMASVVLGVAMAGTTALTGALTPTQKVSDARSNFSLETMIPKSFAGWTVDTSVVPLTPDPTQKELIAALYDQTLSRTYVNAQGQRVMLSIAYGGDQSKQLQLHLPEVCYVAQGFDMVKDHRDELATGFGKLPVKRLVARQNARNEPITYWITIGDKAVMSGLDQKLQRFMYGLSGRIPDGMLVRVSTIEADETSAYKVQDRFVKQMLSAVDPQARSRLLGAATSHG
ncbi:EpsI family protein [Massilia sp. WF1]|uniref:exosortase-associated protein EpsI, B-type n=1 Tax=unclassified Massilia TaxID=2609279 RepID=UPI00064A6EAD|nr:MULTISPECIES: exosortase-associated protein EpsI, B-type [unclassified Massilia]ALK96336.1 methanolan biosynthesis protein EpsI [Massilia sp. WG5]KLU37679.1 EpsI family protein [Massilia sp. WF1]